MIEDVLMDTSASTRSLETLWPGKVVIVRSQSEADERGYDQEAPATLGQSWGGSVVSAHAGVEGWAEQPQITPISEWDSAGVPVESHPGIPVRAQEPVIHPSANPMLTDRVKETLGRLIPLLQHAARHNYIQVSKVEISGFVDLDDESSEVVVTQVVNAPAYTALHYWDKLGPLIEAWIRLLPEELAVIADERIAVEVQWSQQ